MYNSYKEEFAKDINKINSLFDIYLVQKTKEYDAKIKALDKQKKTDLSKADKKNIKQIEIIEQKYKANKEKAGTDNIDKYHNYNYYKTNYDIKEMTDDQLNVFFKIWCNEKKRNATDNVVRYYIALLDNFGKQGKDVPWKILNNTEGTKPEDPK